MKHTIHTSCTTHSFGLFNKLVLLLAISAFANINIVKANTLSNLNNTLLTGFNLDFLKFHTNSHEHFDGVYSFGSVDDHSHVTSTSGTPMNTCSVIAAEDSADDVSAESSLFLSVSCNAMVNVSLDENCEALITPDMMLEGEYPDLTDFSVNITDNGVSLGNTVTGAQIGEILTVEITEISTGNYCWGSILVEDKLPPTVDCTPAMITIQCYEDLSIVPAPTTSDNCDNTVQVVLVNEEVVDNGCNNPDNFITTITRTYSATDANGNVAVNTCDQVINIQKADIDDIVFPSHVDGANSLNCADASVNITPAATGWPTINGLPIQTINSCTFAVSYSDVTLDGCGGSYAVVRTWSVLDWCGNPGGANPLTASQTIKVKDLDGPDISCPTSSTLSINTQNCTVTTLLPAATITDGCSEYSVQTLYPGGVLDGNGGMAFDIPIGTQTVTYRATDGCGNMSECTMELIVEDAQAPTAICDQITSVSLNSSGIAVLNVASLDDGSYDYCTNSVVFDGRKMTDPAGVYTSEIEFDCTEEGQTNIVEMRVTDLNGNSNTCMVEVIVEDKLPPIVSCPADITLDCLDDYTDLSLTGTATNVENCPTVFFIGYEDVGNTIDNCGEGTVTRRFKIIDGAGMADSCDQIITIEDTDLFDENDIVWPADYSASDCTSASELTPALLPTGFNEPTWNGNGCDLLAVNYEDQLFNVADSACFKIVRHWTILDWCQFDQANPEAGFFEHSQVIKVTDNTAPEIFCMNDLFVKIQGPICDSTVYIPRPTVMDCSQDTVITVFTEGLGAGYGPFFNVPLGDYDVVYTASDGCGNVSTCTSVLHVEDGTNPTVYCKNGVIFEMGQDAVVELWASDIDNGSYDNCSEVTLHFQQNNLESNVMYFDCSQVGEVTIPLYVTDESFNQDFCMVTLIIQDNMEVCDEEDDGLVEVAGLISNEEDESIENVNMTISGYMSEQTMSSETGNYAFDLLSAEDYTVAPEMDSDILNGVTTYDLVLMSKHILGVAPLDSPYKIIAADINNSGAITTADMVALRKVILQIEETFPNNTSWRFVDAAYQFPVPTNPFYEFYPEVYSINNLNGSMNNIDFIGVKIGDINGSASTNASTGAEERSLPSKAFRVGNKELRVGKVEEIKFSTSDLAQLEGFQLELAIDPSKVDILDIETNILTIENVGLAKISEGTILLSWNNKVELDSEAQLLSIKVMANERTNTKDIISLTTKHISNEVYGLNGERFEAVLSFNGQNQDLQYSNSPNPFKNQTSIWLELTHTEDVELTIYDFSGKIIKQTQELRNRGLNEWMITRKDLGTSGVYFYTVRINENTLNGKMIMLD